MEGNVSVNGVRVTILKALPPEKVRGKPRGSILIISWNCEIHPNARKYCDLHEIKILRMN